MHVHARKTAQDLAQGNLNTGAPIQEFRPAFTYCFLVCVVLVQSANMKRLRVARAEGLDIVSLEVLSLCILRLSLRLWEASSKR